MTTTKPVLSVNETKDFLMEHIISEGSVNRNDLINLYFNRGGLHLGSETVTDWVEDLEMKGILYRDYSDEAIQKIKPVGVRIHPYADNLFEVFSDSDLTHALLRTADDPYNAVDWFDSIFPGPAMGAYAISADGSFARSHASIDPEESLPIPYVAKTLEIPGNPNDKGEDPFECFVNLIHRLHEDTDKIQMVMSERTLDLVKEFAHRKNDGAREVYDHMGFFILKTDLDFYRVA